MVVVWLGGVRVTNAGHAYAVCFDPEDDAEINGQEGP